MPDSVQQLVTDVREEGQFDATEAQVLNWLTRRHRKMVVRSRCFRKTVSLGSTGAGQRGYALPAEVVEILELRVAGAVYGNARHEDLAQGARGWLWLGGDGGVAARDDDEDGVEMIALYPTPTVAGDSIEIFAAVRPPDLVIGTDSTLRIPEDFTDQLVAGAIATGLRRLEHRPDLAQPYEQDFADGCEELRRQVQRKHRGSGPQQIRVVGLNA